VNRRRTSTRVALLLAVLLGLLACVTAQLLLARPVSATPVAPPVPGPAGSSYATWWLIEPGRCVDLDLATWVVEGGRGEATCGEYQGQRVIVLRAYGAVFAATWRGVLIEHRAALPLLAGTP
jgi:hypothetical protein